MSNCHTCFLSNDIFKHFLPEVLPNSDLRSGHLQTKLCPEDKYLSFLSYRTLCWHPLGTQVILVIPQLQNTVLASTRNSSNTCHSSATEHCAGIH